MSDIKTIEQLKENKMKLVSDARRLNEMVTSEKRDYTSEENEQYERIMSDVETLDSDIVKAEAAEKRNAFIQRQDEWAASSAGRKTAPSIPNALIGTTNDNDQYQMRAFRKGLSFGLNSLNSAEMRALANDSSDAAGGYLSAPAQWTNELIEKLKDAVFVRQHAKTFTLHGSDTKGFPVQNTEIEDGTWTTEIATVDEETALDFAKKELRPQQLSKLVKISLKLLTMTEFPIESWVADRLVYKFAVTQEKGFLTGTGTTQPLGVFVADAAGVSTGRDVTVGSTTEITADGLQDVKWNLKQNVLAGSRWTISRTGMKQVAKLKDGEGRYMFQPSLVLGTPDMLLGQPVDVSEHAPSTFTTGQYVCVLGNWGLGYYIVDMQQMQIQRITELYAATSQLGLIGRMYTDGAPVNEVAFSRGKLA